jgi:hypothetical protein
MAILIPIKYRGTRYQSGINSEMREESAPFGIPRLKKFPSKYSLHTDLSRRPQKDFTFLDEFQTIKMSYAERIPQLWFNERWAEEFSLFIKRVVDQNSPPLIIEIHPPYRDYCPTIERFLESYRVFEERISSFYPGTEILIENRYGSRYKGGAFLISSSGDISDLINHLQGTELRLGVVIDFPQLFSQMGMGNMTDEELETTLKDIFVSLKGGRRRIKGIHLWGPKRIVRGNFKGVHQEDLNGLFQKKESMKRVFLKGFYELLNDDVPRYFIPEVGSNGVEENSKKVKSIVDDLLSVGFVFKS